MNNRLKAYLLLLTTSIIWGFASPIIKYTLKFIPPFAFLFWRFLLSSLVILPIFIVYLKRKKIKLTFHQILNISFLGFLGTTFTLSLLFIGYNFTTAIDGSLIYSVAPILVIIGGFLFLKEKITNRIKIGAVFALAGSLATIIQPIIEGKAMAKENITGNILVLISAVAWAAYCLMTRKVESRKRGKVDPLVLTSLGFFAGLITIIPLFLWEQNLLLWDLQSITAGSLLNHYWITIASQLNHFTLPGILYMSLLSSVIAYFTYNMGYALIEASEATVFDYLKPVFAAPLAVIWLGEKITFPFLIGAGLIFLGVFLTEYKKKLRH